MNLIRIHAPDELGSSLPMETTIDTDEEIGDPDPEEDQDEDSQRRWADDDESQESQDMGEQLQQQDESITLRASDLADQSRSYSLSPSRLDGSDLLDDLNEMSTYADRLDSILDQSDHQQLTVLQRRSRSRSPALRASPIGREQLESNDDEVD